LVLIANFKNNRERSFLLLNGSRHEAAELKSEFGNTCQFSGRLDRIFSSFAGQIDVEFLA